MLKFCFEIVIVGSFLQSLEATFCDNVIFKNGEITESKKSPYPVGTILTFECDIGYKGVGTNQINCLSNGHWSDPVPFCQAFVCSKNLKEVEEGRTCQKSCIDSFDCPGSFTRCLCDDVCGKSCYNRAFKCPTPEAPENGYVLYNKLSHGHTISYGCDKGYALSGPQTRTCRSDQNWSGYQAKCIEYGVCGQAGDVQKEVKSKVIEGTDAQIGAWPWQAQLFRRSEGLHKDSGFGGGSILNNKWILTAGHNYPLAFPRNKNTKEWKKFFLVVVGISEYPEKGKLPPTADIIEPEILFTHSKFEMETNDYDIALIRVGNHVKWDGEKFVIDSSQTPGVLIYSQYIRPVCFPCMKDYDSPPNDFVNKFDSAQCSTLKVERDSESGTETIVTGFGFKRDPGSSFQYVPKVLQQGHLSILAQIKCIQAAQNSQIARFTDRMICAKSHNKSQYVDSCQGDSGGPLVKVVGPKENRRWIQIGIVSWGLGCGNMYPGFYAYIPYLMDWIIMTIKKNEESNKKVPGSEAPVTTKEITTSTSSPSEIGCGQVDRKYANRGGTAALPGEWPWHVNILIARSACSDFISSASLLPSGSRSGSGSGSLINNNWILSASYIFTIMKIALREQCAILILEARAFQSAEVFLHPNRNLRSSFDYDAALIRIGKPVKTVRNGWMVDDSIQAGIVQFNDFIRPVCLPCVTECGISSSYTVEECAAHGKALASMKSATAGQRTLMTGVNVRNTKVLAYNNLEKDVVDILNRQWCSSELERIDNTMTFTDSMLCTLSRRADAPCLSTGGSALVKQIKRGDKTCWVQLGIATFGGACNERRSPEYYTDVTTIHSWIKQTIQLKGSEAPVTTKEITTLTSSRSEIGCGQVDRKYANRGGTAALPGEWPWHVNILIARSACSDFISSALLLRSGSGSLINNNWILSASYIFTIMKIALREQCAILILGSTKFSSSSKEARAFQSAEVFLHPNRNLRSSFDYDAALIRIGKPVKTVRNGWMIDDSIQAGIVQFNDFIRPVCLPCVTECGISSSYTVEECAAHGKALASMKSATTGQRTLMTGVNVRDTKVLANNNLEKDAVGILNRPWCSRKLEKIDNTMSFTDSMLCTLSRKADAPCLSTGGSALVKQIKRGDKTCWVQLGIATFGGACNERSPQYYTDVTTIHSWIKQTIQPKVTCGTAPLQKKASDSGYTYTAYPGQWPWKATILSELPLARTGNILTENIDGGTIINKKWILTGGESTVHRSCMKCVIIVLGVTSYPINVYTMPDYMQIYRAKNVFLHPQRSLKEYDVALIEIGDRIMVGKLSWVVDPHKPSGEIEFNDYIRPVCLPCINDGVKKSKLKSCRAHGDHLALNVPSNVPIYFAGLNIINFKQTSKMESDPTTIVRRSDKSCQGSPSIKSTKTILCVRPSRADAPCRGTGGDGLVKKIVGDDGKERWVQLGFSGFGPPCGSKDKMGNFNVNFFMDVSTFNSWIMSHVGKDMEW
uniref:transmembrane protease serine 9-like isoform X2 n=1 Tax=Styela clava TaxID=7725 RepID=UPI00193A467B|nr:transmembrane protease serine 9-like isoform X2 [Styela clava]